MDFSEFFEDVAARTPAPGGGAVAAVAAALAAALVEMAARFSDDEAAAAEAASLRARFMALADEDAEAYRAVLETKGRERANALSHAADVPLEIAETAAVVTRLAGQLVDEGNPNLRGDAAAAALLAGAAVRAAANLVEINLADAPADERLERARSLAAGPKD